MRGMCSAAAAVQEHFGIQILLFELLPRKMESSLQI